MSFKMHENFKFDQIFVENTENDGTAFNINFVLDAKVKNISSVSIYHNSIALNIACNNKRSF